GKAAAEQVAGALALGEPGADRLELRVRNARGGAPDVVDGAGEIGVEKAVVPTGARRAGFAALQRRLGAFLEFAPQRSLEVRIGGVAELGDEAQHSRGAGTGLGGKLGNRRETDGRIARQ